MEDKSLIDNALVSNGMEERLLGLTGEGKLLSGIRSMYVDSSACVVRIKGGESEWFGIDSGVRQRCIISPWLLNVYMDGVMKEVKMGMERGVNFLEDG